MEAIRAALKQVGTRAIVQKPAGLRTRLVIALTIGFVILFAIVISLKVARDHQTTLMNAERELAATTSSLAAQLRAILFGVEALMEQVGTAHGAGEVRLHQTLANQTETLLSRIDLTVAVKELFVINAKGESLFESDPSSQTSLVDWTDEKFFRFHAEQSGSQFFVSKSDQLYLSKRLDNDIGQFAGIVLVALERDYLTQLSQSINFDARKHVVLAANTGAVLAFSPASIDADLTSVTSLLGIAWPLPDDAVPLMAAYTRNAGDEELLVLGRQMTDTPFYLFVAERVDDVLASWRADLRFYFLIVLAPTLFGAAVCTILLMHMSEQKAAQDARRASEARLNLAITSAQCGIWDWDLGTNRLKWSASMYKMMGREPGKSDLDLDEVYELMHPDDRQALDEITEAAAIGDREYDKVFRLRHAHGHWLWVHAKGQIWDVNGQSAKAADNKRFMGIAIDITELKEAETRISEAEARLRDAIENISEAFVLWDANDRLILCNRNYAAFYQIDPSVLKPGARRREVIAAASAPIEILHQEAPADAQSDPSASKSIAKVTELQHVGNRWIHVNTQGTSSGGQVTVGTDVTPLKEQEAELVKNEGRLKKYVEELKKSEAKLRRESAERAELAMKYAAEKTRAEEAARSKTEFLSNMSHELRTPLNAVMGFAQIMEDGLYGPLGDDRYHQYTNHILESSQHLLELINDILDMSKIESGKMELHQEDIRLDEVIQSCARFIEPKVFEAGLQLSLEIPSLPSVYADQRATKQTLLNLLTNAVKFTPRSGIITIQGEVHDDYVAISVKDTGIGISEQDLKRIGKPFEQIENQESKKHRGSGLGLALSKSLMKLQGGTLVVQSKLGLGTKVRITLPRTAPQEKTQIADDAPPPIRAAQG